jgi:16S rRNA (guanine527-N7)-methyltransferase
VELSGKRGNEVSDNEGAVEAREARLQAFAAMLRASPHNLLSPRGLEELEARHFPESLSFARLLPSAATLLDVGSGGGLPGVVIAIARPDIAVHLLEATKKKADFLVEVSEHLGLGCEVHHGRAEELSGSELRGRFDVVTARAVAPLERLVPWCAPFLRPGGFLFAIKGERWAEELVAARPILASSGMVVSTVPEPDGGHEEGATGRDHHAPRVVVLERARKGGMQPAR